MSYTPGTDFVALWRNVAGTVSKLEIPALDLIITAMARAGIITLSVSGTAPVANQSITAWLRPAAPSYSAEGAFFLWDSVSSGYLPASPALFLQFLEACNGDSGVSWWPVGGGPPANTTGSNGDFAIRLDTPGGIYGPKAGGAWPVTPLPGTTNTIESAALDLTFGSTPGLVIYRGALQWTSLPIGATATVMISNGALPAWANLSDVLDSVFGAAQGSILYRGAALWNDLPPGVANQVLATAGPGADPAWAPRTAEFPAGTVMLFRQTAAPTGWTKQVALNDYGIRVVSGAVGQSAGTPFTTVFGQTAVGNTTLTVATMPAHHHLYTAPVQQNIMQPSGSTVQGAQSASNTGDTGGDGAHTHSVNLTLSYLDVIIASKN